MVKIKINGIELEVKDDSTILEVCKEVNINIPTLCHMNMIDGESINCKGTCRVCVVEVVGRRKLLPSCSEKVKGGMEIITNSTKALEGRKTAVELLLSNHPNDCLNCERNLSCELRILAGELGIGKRVYQGEESKYDIDNSTESIVRDMNKCILCRRCVTACGSVQGINILTPIKRGFDTKISTFLDLPLGETECTYCGQCVAVCPTGALTEVMDYRRLSKEIDNKEKFVIAQIAPAVRVALGEEFGIDGFDINIGKIVSAMKMLRFDKVFDTNFAADLTIMEEAFEFLNGIETGRNAPLITSCCPAWIRFAELNYPQEMKYISSCKSPQQIFGAIAKSYLAEKYGIDKEKMVVVSIMPCVAKKYEASREELAGDVDIVLTTRELAKIIRENGIDLENLKESHFDNPLGTASGAGMIFGTSGGVMEAALRTSYEWITNEELKNVNFKDVRGLEGIKEATIELKNKNIKVAAVSSLKNARKIMDSIRDKSCSYDFIEIMACPGGCINGGGQPYIKSDREKLEVRMDKVYKKDIACEIRKSHENPIIKEIYDEYLGHDGKKAHKLLHVKYEK